MSTQVNGVDPFNLSNPLPIDNLRSKTKYTCTFSHVAEAPDRLSKKVPPSDILLP